MKEPEKEWTFKKTMVRLFAYPLCLVLIIFGFYMIITPVDVQGLSIGIAVIVLASTYLYADLKLLFGKKEDRE